MNRNRLLIGISAAAFAAGMAAVPAGAQTTNTNTSTGNCRVATGEISGGGTCNIDNGAPGSAAVPGNDRNSAFVSQSGEGNFAEIVQRGDDNVGIIEQQGEDNSSLIRQTGDDHYADNDQEGVLNSSEIYQADDQNSATVLQVGEENESFVVQGTTGVLTGGDSRPQTPVNDGLAVNETGGTANSDQGEDNFVSVSQNGSNLSSYVSQRRLNEFTELGVTGFRGPADDNSATVTQTGAGSESAVAQYSRGNIARVSLSGGGTNVEADDTPSTTDFDVVQSNSSSIAQYNQFYTASSTGALRASGRTSPSQQQGPEATNNPRSDNVADVAISGLGNSSQVEQNGVLNNALVSMLNGGAGNTGDTSDLTETDANGRLTNVGPSGRQLRANAKAGNDSIILQYGRGNSAAVSLGGLGGQGNRSSIYQGVFTNFDNYQESDLARDHQALAWQRGILDTATIIQENNERGAGGAAQNGSYADVSQRSLNSTVYVEQEGTNSATVSQGTGTATGDNSVRIRQLDAGNASSSTGGGIFDDPSTGTVLARNTVAVSQTGIDNGITVDQDARNATAIVWQQVGSRQNRVEVEQGTGAQTAAQNLGRQDQQGCPVSGSVPASRCGGAPDFEGLDGPVTTPQTVGDRNVGSQGGFFAAEVPADAGDTGAGALNLTADVTQSGRGSTARVRQDGQNLSLLATQAGTATNANGTAANSANLLQVSQINSLNSATVTQSGFNLTATVDQRGSGAVGTDNVTRRNLVTIQQTGDGHRARANQLSGVGPSGANSPAGTSPAAGDPSDPTLFRFARAAGRQSAEIQIVQSGSTNTTNTGTGSTLDDVGNDAFVEQQGLGQFARIDQRGAGNDAGILQTGGATNAVAVIEQFGNGNRFFITQDAPGQYMHIRQNGNNNASTVGVFGPTPTSAGTGSETPFAGYPFAPPAP